MPFDRREIAPGLRAVVSTALEERGVLAAFTERDGGASGPPYRSLNLSFRVGDDPAAVTANRRALADALDVPSFATAEQVHGNKVVRIGARRAGAGFEESDQPVTGADALATASTGPAMAILTADCLPVVLVAPAGLLAVVHAGWRGLAAGILDRVAALFPQPQEVRAAVGPAIGPCHYEVGEDVVLAVASGSEAGARSERRDGRLFLDLAGTARAILRARGIRKMEDSGLCTACEEDRFYSHRRDGQATGRQGVVAVRR